MLSDVMVGLGGGGGKGLERPIFIIFIKDNWIYAMTRHHAYNIFLTRNLPFDSDFRQRSHPLSKAKKRFLIF